MKTTTFDMTILESKCVGWVLSYHRCSSVMHLDQLGFQLLLQVVGLRRSGATDPRLDSQCSQLPAVLNSRWTFVTNFDTKLIVHTFWTTYLSDAQVCWQYGICACSHQTTWQTESFEYICLKTEQQYRNKPSVTHLESQVGCSLVAVRTVESVGIAVAEMPTGYGESLYKICKKYNLKAEHGIPGAHPYDAAFRWNTKDGSTGFVQVSPDTANHQISGEQDLQTYCSC